jgi:hypothetical protein
MLDLQPRVHFEEVEGCRIRSAREVEQEFHGAGVLIRDRCGGRRRCGGDSFPQRIGNRGRWALLDDLLVTTLERAVALEEVNDVAVAVAEDLHFDVARPYDQPFHVQGAIAESRERLAPRRTDGFRDGSRLVDTMHALPAAALGGLDEGRVAHRLDRAPDALVGLIGRHFTRHDRNTCGRHQLTRLDLGTHACDDIRRRSHEEETGGLAGGGELVAL